jgi:hypothetical protein
MQFMPAFATLPNIRIPGRRRTTLTSRVNVVRRYGYKIFYTILNDDTVEIMHVRHPARRSWRGR